MKLIQIILILFIFSISCEDVDNVVGDNLEENSLIEVYVVLSETCPVAQYMTLPINDSYEAFASESVVFRAYFPSILSNSKSIASFAEKYSILFNCIDDNNGELVSLLGATVYSEVFIKYNNNLVYRGMVDDSYTALGQWSPANNNYLYDTLELLLEGEDLDYYENEAIGCLI